MWLDAAMNIEWKIIPGHDNYEASNDGRVRHRNGTERGQATNESGHKVVRLDGQRHYVHRLVLLAFKGEPDPARDLGCHRNDNPGDNRLENLYWGSHADNRSDAVANGRFAEKTHCKRGHELSGNNLDPASLKQGLRACRACKKATGWRNDFMVYRDNGVKKKLPKTDPPILSEQIVAAVADEIYAGRAG